MRQKKHFQKKSELEQYVMPLLTARIPKATDRKNPASESNYLNQNLPPDLAPFFATSSPQAAPKLDPKRYQYCPKPIFFAWTAELIHPKKPYL